MNDERENIWKEVVVTCSSRVLICAWKDCENHERSSDKIAGDPGEIRTEDFPNTSVEVTATPTRSVWRSGQTTSVCPSIWLSACYDMQSVPKLPGRF